MVAMTPDPRCPRCGAPVDVALGVDLDLLDVDPDSGLRHVCDRDRVADRTELEWWRDRERRRADSDLLSDADRAEARFALVQADAARVGVRR